MNRVGAVTAKAAITALVLLALPTSATPPSAKVPAGPIIRTEDVARFYKVYRDADGRPTADELQRDYIDQGSPGLRHLAEIRNVSGATIAKAIATQPQIFSDAKRCMAV